MRCIQLCIIIKRNMIGEHRESSEMLLLQMQDGMSGRTIGGLNNAIEGDSCEYLNPRSPSPIPLVQGVHSEGVIGK